MLGVAFALAASLTDGGRAALDHGFWETTLPYITDTGDRLPLPTSPQRELLRGADAINQYFLDASRVFVLSGDSAARLVALTAGTVAAIEQRSSMVDCLRAMAMLMRTNDASGASKLDDLADDIGRRDWDTGDIVEAKHMLLVASRTYARALDLFDADIFRRQSPHLFTQQG